MSTNDELARLNDICRSCGIYATDNRKECAKCPIEIKRQAITTRPMVEKRRKDKNGGGALSCGCKACGE